MKIKRKIPLLFTLLVFGILLSNNTIHYLRSKEQLLNQNEREIALIAQELSYQVLQAKDGSLFVEDIIGKELRMASIAIQKSLPSKHEQVKNDQLTALAKELMISHITLLAKSKNDIIGVKSSDPNEINMSTKDWGYWYDAYQQLFRNKNAVVEKGQSLPHYWSGPIEIASSNPDHTDKWGYYYDGTTNYIIDPYLRDKAVLEYGNRFGPKKIIDRFTSSLKGVLELTVFNPAKFGEKRDLDYSNGNQFVKISSRPIWYGNYHFKNTLKDKKYIDLAFKTNKTLNYIEKLNGKTVQKTFVPVGIHSDQPFVLGFTYDYGIIQQQLQQEMISHLILSGIFMLIVLLISAIFSRTITKPIDFIAEQVNEIAKGNFGKTIDTKKKDELGFLAENVNAMSLSLKSYVDHFKDSQKIIEFQALHDPLTALPNRRYAMERLIGMLEKAKLNNQNVAILFIDIDRFKNVNDSLGHNKGDELIQQIANRLKECFPQDNCVISRQGGDEFLIMLENVQRDNLKNISNKVVELLKKPYFIDETDIFVGASCGISLFPEHSENMDTLIMYADMAMYEAKNQGGNCAVFYSHWLNERNHNRIRIESRLRKAIDEQQIDVVYQPMINANNGNIIGAEALVRWNDTELGFVSPSTFIPVAEDSGLIQQLWEQVMTRACSDAKRWNEKYSEELKMAVNFSAKQFQETPTMVKKVREILEECRFPTAQFEIEITESVLLYNTNETIAALSELQQDGVTISIDDFGTGYSSLSYLKKFPIDKLKIDRSFIQDIDENYNHTEITDAIINLARSLHLQVIAEGVEKDFQLRYLLENDCEEMQGYYFSKPVESAIFETLLAEQGVYTAHYKNR
ncbi:MAG: EAL domain-containing protein [Bacillota bacterium]|nr:EAL domain-containing protein [Bacillota bacterium]